MPTPRRGRHASPEMQERVVAAIQAARDAGEYCPTVRAIGRRAGCETSTAARAVRDLEAAGRVRREIVVIGGSK